jgi:hypothetical protein
MTNIFNSNPVAMPNVCYNTHPSEKEGCEDQGDIMSRQVGGNHYKRAHQPWDIIDAWDMCYYSGNILKYLLRYKYKNGVEDLEKAKHYLEYLIKKEKDAATATRD